jgi:hypothetical protein
MKRGTPQVGPAPVNAASGQSQYGIRFSPARHPVKTSTASRNSQYGIP